MSCIHIFVAIWFISMSLSPVGNPKLMKLPSTRHHAGFGPPSWLSPAESISAPCVLGAALALSHNASCWSHPIVTPPNTHRSVPSKDTAAEMCKKMRTGAVGWGRTMADWFLMNTKPLHPAVSQAHSAVNLASPFLCAILALHPYLKSDHHRAPQPVLHCYSTTACCVSAESPGYCIHWNEVYFETKLCSGEVPSSFEREKQS